MSPGGAGGAGAGDAGGGVGIGADARTVSAGGRSARPARPRGGIALAAAALAVVVALTGCAGPGDGAQQGTGGAAGSTDAGTDAGAEGGSAQGAEAEIPGDTAIGEKTRWVLDVLNADEDTTAEEWEARLHPNFLEEVPASEFADVVNGEVRPAGPFAVSAYDAGETQSVTSIDGSSSFDMQLTIDEEGWIVGIFFASRNSEAG